MQKLTRDEMAQRVARDIPEGAYVNLGIGLPTRIANYLPADKEIFLHSENGLLGMGPKPRPGEEDPELINAGKEYVTLLEGGCYFHHGDSFAMMRGGHLDICVLGAYQVSASGDLANWSTGAPDAIPAVGGAMDLAIGARQVFVMMDHLTRDGECKLVEHCTYPLYTFHFNAVSRDAMIVGLSTGAYTLAADHFYLTKERAEKYDHSGEPTGISDLRLIVRNDESDIHNLGDLASGKKKLVPIHTSDARYTVIENYNKKHPGQQINLQPNGEQSAADIFKAVASGEYDAAIYPIGALLALNKALNLNLKASDSVGLFPNVYLYKKNTDPQLIKAIDAQLVALKKDGTLAELSRKWYAEDVYALPGASDVKVNTDWE